MKSAGKHKWRKPLANPDSINKLIKLGSLQALRGYIEKQERLIQSLHLLCGYEDPEFGSLAKQNFGASPLFADEAVSFLLNESSKADWNPLLYAIFYQRLDMV